MIWSYSWRFMWWLIIRPLPVLICVLIGCILGCLATSQSDGWGGHGPLAPPVPTPMYVGVINKNSWFVALMSHVNWFKASVFPFSILWLLAQMPNVQDLVISCHQQMDKQTLDRQTNHYSCTWKNYTYINFVITGPRMYQQWQMQDFLKEGSVVVSRAQIFEATPTFD